MKSYDENVKIIYKIMYKVYDLMDLILFSNKKSNPRKGLADHLPNVHIKILDVCCGTGNSSIAIGCKNSNNSIVGIDLSNDMLKIATKKTLKHKFTNITFREMNAINMDFQDESFDVVTISLALHEMPQDVINPALTEIKRVLKAGGKFYIIDWEKPKHFISSILFSVFPTLFEPKGFKQFLKINWSELLIQYGLELESVEDYNFTKLIIAKR
jgi:demethylmenaquinone methyltransferase / 2-methoxy-6-polyprenyl-1,4-benzoquinol methylase